MTERKKKHRQDHRLSLNDVLMLMTWPMVSIRVIAPWTTNRHRNLTAVRVALQSKLNMCFGDFFFETNKSSRRDEN